MTVHTVVKPFRNSSHGKGHAGDAEEPGFKSRETKGFGPDAGIDEQVRSLEYLVECTGGEAIESIDIDIRGADHFGGLLPGSAIRAIASEGDVKVFVEPRLDFWKVRRSKGGRP